jgi:hypothetical protein
MIEICHYPGCNTLTRRGLCDFHRPGREMSTAIAIYLRLHPGQDSSEDDSQGLEEIE